MSSFKDQSFESRFKVMGDIAEAKFEELSKIGFVRTGLNRPPINLKNVPAKYRYIPDYMTHRGWVEVMGYGRDQKLKCKKLKWEVLGEYDAEWECMIFLWDSMNEWWIKTLYSDLDRYVGTDFVKGDTFPEGVAYWAFDMKGIREDLGLD